MSEEQFWMYRWIDERGIQTPADAIRVLTHDRGMRSVFNAANAAPTDLVPLDYDEGVIAAGRSMDLSGVLDCEHWQCLTRKVDGLLKDTWHYFDSIVVEGPSALRVQRMARKKEPLTRYRERIINYITALLMLRQQGLDKHLVFREKPQECSVHYDQHLAEANLEWLEGKADEYATQLATVGRLEGKPLRCGDHWHFRYRHPGLRVAIGGTIGNGEGWILSGADWNGHGDPMPVIGRSVFHQVMGHISADVRGAKDLGVPLALGVELEESLLGPRPGQTTVDDVALRLQLPVMENLSARDIIHFKEDHDLDFTRFRNALRGAIQERLTDVSDPDEVARLVYRDVLGPELATIEAKLDGAQKALGKKSGLQLAVGAVTTTVGLISATPPVIAAGLGIMGASPMHAAKYIDDKKEVQLSDMYFAWQAATHEHKLRPAMPRSRKRSKRRH